MRRNDGILKIAESDSFSPVGRLKSAERKWREAGANEYMMRVITEGYSMPFRELPDAKHMNDNKSARDNMNLGLATSGHIFTKVLRVLMTHWRGQGHKVITFLDYGIGGHLNI